jgi:uncharacterized tellurite resistance protein B-like protein
MSVMLKAIQQFFQNNIQAAATTADENVSERSLRLATAALLIELTRADFKVEKSERRMVEDAMQRVFDLTEEETQELVRLAEEEAESSISLYDFTHLIDRNFPLEKKRHIVELLWRVALSDSELEQHEEHMIRKVANLLHLRHEDFIDAKIKARKDLRRETESA